jgi:hypothetical protein
LQEIVNLSIIMPKHQFIHDQLIRHIMIIKQIS